MLTKANYHFLLPFSLPYAAFHKLFYPELLLPREASFHLPRGDAALKSLQDVAGGSWCCPWGRYSRVYVLPTLSHCSGPEGGSLEVTEVCAYMGGPARLAGPQRATRSLSKLIKTLQALAYSEAQASLFSNQCLHCCLFALHLSNIGRNYRAVTDRTVLKWSEKSGRHF